MISKQLVDRLFAQFGTYDINQLSIRQVGKLVAQIEQESGVEFIHMEMGVPGLPASQIGVDAEKEALDKGLASIYPNIEGIPFAKEEIARFVRLFLDIDTQPEFCVPTVGGMQGSFAALLGAARVNPDKPYTLFIDPGFPVQKSQLDLLGLPYKSFDFLNFRGEKLREKLEEFLKAGNICSICYSSPNNPTWCCFSESELKIIGELANKYDVLVIEDLAYFGMDFREHYGLPGQPPFQPTVAKYTDNYMLILSASKIFSYAGQRIAMLVFSEKTYSRPYPNLKKYFPSEKLGRFIPYGVLYATTAGTSHSAQYALAAMLKAVNDNEVDFVKELHHYGEKAKLMKETFLKHGFYIVYEDYERDLADGFYFTIAYPGMTSGELMKKFLYFGISAISLAITGSDNQNGLRACVSFVRMDQMDELDRRLKEFKLS
ncbi:MAG: pyridoxal phosphate-dependent aminotransferase [Porphyromonadaceae bacterium]|jgi:aspartate/methionine/tyrosine aminotransferase|nr:pyridoxal phosphate-dependent aminotransferase [Porphyromonadaceae bacterium]